MDFVWILFEYGQRRRIGREIAPIDYQPLGKVEPNAAGLWIGGFVDWWIGGFIFYDFRINPNGLAQPFLKVELEC